MPRISKKKKISEEQSLLATMPWMSTDFGDTSEIEAYVEETSTWETIAETHSVTGFIDAEDIANFIVSRVSYSQEVSGVLKQVLVSLNGCLACNGIDQKMKQSINQAIDSLKSLNKAIMD